MPPGQIPHPDHRGWYADPSGRHELRWYNGEKWTTAVMDDGVESRLDPSAPEPDEIELDPEPMLSSAPTATWEAAALAPAPSSGRRRPASASWWSQRSNAAKGAVVVGGIVAVLGVFGAINNSRDSSEESQPSTSTSPSTTRERQGTTRPPTTEAVTTVPSTTITTLPPPPTTVPPPPVAPPTAAPQTSPPVAPAPSSCDPNYTGCVQVASDVDCAGGSGNGPAYVNGPVQIIGSDVYDLDSDGDGIGCE